MAQVVQLKPKQFATQAEALVCSLEDRGVTVWMVQLTSSRAFLTFEPTALPFSPDALDLMARICARFLNEHRFAKDLFGWLFATGQVLQAYAERQPEHIRLEDAPT